MRPLLGTFTEVAAGGANAMPALERAFAVMERLQQVLSFHRPDSELSRLNHSDGHWCALSPPTLRVLRLARSLTAASDHYFNCTVGGELILRGKLPDHGGRFLPNGLADDIEIDLDRQRARLLRPVRITLDGIAKGFAVDCAIATLKQAQVNYGWVNAGGDLRVFGNYQLPVSQRRTDGQLRPIGGLTNAAMASSQVGDADGLAGLVVSSRQPLCVEPKVFSIIARFAWRADALTKVAATAPESERAATVSKLGGWLVPDMGTGGM